VGHTDKIVYSESTPSATPSRARRPRRTPEQARRLILETAQALIASTGPEGLRLQDIAAAAGISHPLILHHFGSRERLVRELTREAVDELREKLLAAMGSSEYSVEQQLGRVFDAFRDGLAQRLVWLVTVDPSGGTEGTRLVVRDIVDKLHQRRIAASTPDAMVTRDDTDALIHLVATAALGDALFGAQLHRSAGLPATSETDHSFRLWLAGLIRAHSARGRSEH
jgi:AcrR family transcriptional regulator